MESNSEKKIEWVPAANGNTDALFTFHVKEAIKDPYHDISRKFIEEIPTLGVQCMKCGKTHPLDGILKGCPNCSRTSYAYSGSPSKLNIVCLQCSAGVLSSVKCDCGCVNAINGQTLRKPKTGGCFIATATYGSPLAPELIILRQFRDEVLLESKLGVVFVRVYYFASPTIAAVISRHDSLRTITRRILLEPVLLLIEKLKLVRREESIVPTCNNCYRKGDSQMPQVQRNRPSQPWMDRR